MISVSPPTGFWGWASLRIVGVRPGSADIVLEVWKALGDNVNPLTAASIITGGGYWIVKRITEVIRLKRHIKRQPFAERISAQNAVVVSNSENVTIEVSLDVYELFKSGVIDTDLNKIVSPLRADHIEAAEIGARSPDGTVLRERIDVDERPFFDTTNVTVATTGETSLVAKLNSLTKSTNSGWLYLLDGTRAFTASSATTRNGCIISSAHTAVRSASAASRTWTRT